MNSPSRLDILKTAADLTSKDRNAAYGSPIANLGLAGELKNLVRACGSGRLSPGEQEAIDLLLTKVARIASGSYNPDNYVDAAAYCAIAGEIAATYASATVPPPPTGMSVPH